MEVTRYIICDETTLGEGKAVVLSVNGRLVDADANHTPRLFKTETEANVERDGMQARSQSMFTFTVKPVQLIGYPLCDV